ncbi:MAG TPA: hypothetical protein VJR27_01960 [Candidatus Saccharimonadales bacterium]|nr:hypothetical protein [Candidatus Saccharimonadales bacterium]
MEKFIFTAFLTTELLAYSSSIVTVSEDTLPQPQRFEASQDPSKPPVQIIDLARVALADTLPPRVAEAARSAVAVAGPKGTGSGVKVAPNQFLTAGHMIMGDAPLPEGLNTNSPQFNCKGMTIEAALTLPEGDGAAVTQPITRASGVNHGSDLASNEPWGMDYASLWVDNSSLAATQVPAVTARYPRYMVGKEIFFVNYESLKHRPDQPPTRRRSPLYPAYPNAADNFHEPAMYGGIVIKDLGNIMLIVDGIGRNYSKGHQDDESRSGSSGGASFDANGNLEGLVVAGPPEKETASQIEQDYGVRLEGNPAGFTKDSYMVGFVQKITPAMISEGTTGGLPVAKRCAVPDPQN